MSDPVRAADAAISTFAFMRVPDSFGTLFTADSIPNGADEIARDLPRGVLDSISLTPASVAFCFRDRQPDQARA